MRFFCEDIAFLSGGTFRWSKLIGKVGVKRSAHF